MASIVLDFFRKLGKLFSEKKSTQELSSPQTVTLPNYKKDFQTFISKKGLELFEVADTNSMDPLFDEGHLLGCEKYKEGETPLLEGDIVIYGAENISHRVVRIQGNQILAKGDNNSKTDELILKSQIKYVVRIISYIR